MPKKIRKAEQSIRTSDFFKMYSHCNTKKQNNIQKDIFQKKRFATLVKGLSSIFLIDLDSSCFLKYLFIFLVEETVEENISCDTNGTGEDSSTKVNFNEK